MARWLGGWAGWLGVGGKWSSGQVVKNKKDDGDGQSR